MSEKTQFSCPHCQTKLRVRPERAGEQAPCPSCGKPLTIPEAPLGVTPQPPVTLTGKKVLIVDDDMIVIRAVTKILSSRGVQVKVAMDAITAVAAARKELPDVILLDLGLPGGHGTKVLQRLSNLRSSMATPVIVLTASESPEDEIDATEAGAVAYLHKPLNAEALLDALQNALV